MRIILLLHAVLLCSPVCLVYGQDILFRPPPTPVLSDQVQVCQHLVLAKEIASEKAVNQDNGSSRFEIVEIGFSHGDRFHVGQIIEMRGHISDQSSANYALMGRDDRTEGWYSPLKVSPEAWAYIAKIPLLTTDPDAHAKRASWFLDYLEHPDPLISADAFAELSSASHHLVLAFNEKFPREQIMAALESPKTPTTRIAFYGLMAGYCGRPEDAAILEKRIFARGERYRPYLPGLVVGYLLIKGEEGLKVLEDRMLKAKVATNLEEIEPSRPFSDVYETMRALEYMWQHEPDCLPKYRLQQAMQSLLDYPELADLAIANLKRWKDWSIQDHLMAMYFDENFNTDAIKRPIASYLYCCSQDTGEPTADGSMATRPEHAVKAEQNLKLLKERDPKNVQLAIRFWNADEEARSAYRRTPPILENAEDLERIAKAASSGLSGCGDGSFQFLDHSGRARRIFSGLDPIHVFGDSIDAKVLSKFLEARIDANQHKGGPMEGERQFLLNTILNVVELSEDDRFFDLLPPLLEDPIPAVRLSVQGAMLSIADRNPARRPQVLDLLNKHGWSRMWQSENRYWIP